MIGSLRNFPRGFSINHHFGCSSSIILHVCLTNSSARRALSVLGACSGGGVQFFPIAATENPSHGGDAQRISGEKGKSSFDKDRISATRSCPSISYTSVVKVSCPCEDMTRLNERVPANSSIVFTQRVYTKNSLYYFKVFGYARVCNVKK